MQKILLTLNLKQCLNVFQVLSTKKFGVKKKFNYDGESLMVRCAYTHVQCAISVPNLLGNEIKKAKEFLSITYNAYLNVY